MAISNDPLYTPTPPTIGPQTEDTRNVVDWMQRELYKISTSLSDISRLQLAVISAPPVTPREGLVTINDGTNWNPNGLSPLLPYKSLLVYRDARWRQADLGPMLIGNDGLITLDSVNSARPEFIMTNTFADANAPSFNMVKVRPGPAATQAGDAFGSWIFSGYASGSTRLTAEMICNQPAAVSGTIVPSQFQFFTTPEAGPVFNNVFQMGSDGNFSIGGTIIAPLTAVATPTNANAAAAGVPLKGLYRDTADPSKVYVRTV